MGAMSSTSRKDLTVTGVKEYVSLLVSAERSLWEGDTCWTLVSDGGSVIRVWGENAKGKSLRIQNE